MIGIGIDLVDVDRFRNSMIRTPGLKNRLFLPSEQEYSERQTDPTERYAARFAAKEAVLLEGNREFVCGKQTLNVGGQGIQVSHKKANDLARVS